MRKAGESKDPYDDHSLLTLCKLPNGTWTSKYTISPNANRTGQFTIGMNQITPLIANPPSTGPASGGNGSPGSTARRK